MSSFLSRSLYAALLIVATSSFASAQARQPQDNVPPAVEKVENAVEDAVERFRVGVKGGIGLDPELIMFGAHASFGPIFTRQLEFRPGIEIGLGEVTTSVGLDLDFLYALPGSTRTTRWAPYVGIGPTFGLSHRGFEAEAEDPDDDRNRFDFGDTDPEAGLNFIAGARTPSGLFVELKATAYGVTAIRLLAGFNF